MNISFPRAILFRGVIDQGLSHHRLYIPDNYGNYNDYVYLDESCNIRYVYLCMNSPDFFLKNKENEKYFDYNLYTISPNGVMQPWFYRDCDNSNFLIFASLQDEYKSTLLLYADSYFIEYEKPFSLDKEPRQRRVNLCMKDAMDIFYDKFSEEGYSKYDRFINFVQIDEVKKSNKKI